MSSLAVFEGLNERQAEFARLVSEGKDPHDAAKLAGYLDFVQAGTKLLHSPAVLAAIHAGIQKRLQHEAGASLRVLHEIREDPKAPARVRADVSVHIMKMAGHVVPTHKDDGTPHKPLAQMTQSELLEFIERNQRAIDDAERQLAGQAKDVTPGSSVHSSVPDPAIVDAKALDYLD